MSLQTTSSLKENQAVDMLSGAGYGKEVTDLPQQIVQLAESSNDTLPLGPSSANWHNSSTPSCLPPPLTPHEWLFDSAPAGFSYDNEYQQLLNDEFNLSDDDALSAGNQLDSLDTFISPAVVIPRSIRDEILSRPVDHSYFSIAEIAHNAPSATSAVSVETSSYFDDYHNAVLPGYEAMIHATSADETHKTQTTPPVSPRIQAARDWQDRLAWEALHPCVLYLSPGEELSHYTAPECSTSPPRVSPQVEQSRQRYEATGKESAFRAGPSIPTQVSPSPENPSSRDAGDTTKHGNSKTKINLQGKWRDHYLYYTPKDEDIDDCDLDGCKVRMSKANIFTHVQTFHGEYLIQGKYVWCTRTNCRGKGNSCVKGENFRKHFLDDFGAGGKPRCKMCKNVELLRVEKSYVEKHLQSCKGYPPNAQEGSSSSATSTCSISTAVLSPKSSSAGLSACDSSAAAPTAALASTSTRRRSTKRKFGDPEASNSDSGSDYRPSPTRRKGVSDDDFDDYVPASRQRKWKGKSKVQ